LVTLHETHDLGCGDTRRTWDRDEEAIVVKATSRGGLPGPQPHSSGQTAKQACAMWHIFVRSW